MHQDKESSFFIVVVLLGIAFGGFSKINILPYFRHSTHYNFLSIFVPAIGIITAISAYLITGKLGFHDLKKSAGLYAGIAEALGFLTVGLILLFGLGWGEGTSLEDAFTHGALQCQRSAGWWDGGWRKQESDWMANHMLVFI